MDKVYSRFENDCHERVTHHAKTMEYLVKQDARALKEFWRRNAGYAPLKVDLWTQLGKYKQHQHSGVTGPLIRKGLRTFLEKEQNHLCCYCQRPLVNIAHAKPIEHILPRADFVQYTFHFWNLAVACFDCNQIKSDKVWAADNKKDQPLYPAPGTFTEMYHPRFHSFAKHVRFIRVQTNEHVISLYKGKTPQGRHLCLNLLSKRSAREIQLNSNPELKQALEVINAHAEANPGKSLPQFLALADALSKSVSALVSNPPR
ncbi:HNH endonuclease [Pseudomonas xanthosomatis]|uniref:HNH endonuclease n=1 Tax=Pseudomonas xanthosomatis TaxID=2842356 RepID=UPI003511F897